MGYHPDPDDILWQCWWAAMIGSLIGDLSGAVIGISVILVVNGTYFWWRDIRS